MPEATDAHEPESDSIGVVTPLDSHASGVEILPLVEVVASTGALAAAASAIVKAKIEKRADVRMAEIEAETRRLEIEAETRRVRIQESAETRRERIRQEGGDPPQRSHRLVEAEDDDA